MESEMGDVAPNITSSFSMRGEFERGFSEQCMLED